MMVRQRPGFQHIEDLATAYWLSECLFAAVEMNIFGLIDTRSKSVGELAKKLGAGREELSRFLSSLCQLGLIFNSEDGLYFNSREASRYLVPGKKDYQGASVLWRKELGPRWAGLKDRILGEKKKKKKSPPDNGPQKRKIERYIRAMDCVARVKAEDILDILGPLPAEGEILDTGAGSGAISAVLLDRAPKLRATLMDIRQVSGLTRRMMEQRGLKNRINVRPANILDPWPFDAGQKNFRMVILSNIIHVYSQKELPHILGNAARCLAKDGLLLIHDFFPEHYPTKAGLFDLNMLLNTYNGRVFQSEDVRKRLLGMGLSVTGLIPLPSDTALLAASKDPAVLSRLRPDPVSILAAKIKGLGFKNAVPVRSKDVHIPGWTKLRCRYGCENFGAALCPPKAPGYEETKNLIRRCSKALLLEGEPPTRDFQLMVLKAEKEAFVSGFYKVFSLWAGPCAICSPCKKNKKCKKPNYRRPSMEGAGIDVFETVRRAGLDPLRTLAERDEFVRYFALIILE